MRALGVRDWLAQPGHPEATAIPGGTCKARTTIGLLKTWLKPNLQTLTTRAHFASLRVSRFSTAAPDLLPSAWHPVRDLAK